MQKSSSLAAASLAIALASVTFCSTAQAQWGTLKGQVVLDGALPDIKPLIAKGDTAAKDAAVCSAQDVPDEKLVVDSGSKGIANVVIHLAKKPAKVHPDLVKSKEPVVIFDQKGCKFLPHVMVVRTDQMVRVLSDDAVAHNTHTNPLKNKAENFIVAPNDRKGVELKPMKLLERVPVKVTCDIHSHMSAYWVVMDHPYVAVTDDKGHFVIADLPVGDHEFIVWQESSGWLTKNHKVKIKEGDNEDKPLKFTAAQILK